MPGENIQDWSTTAANNATADSLIGWAEGMARAGVNDSARSMMAAVAKWRNLTQGAITTGGTGSAFTFSSGRSHTGSVPTNMMVMLKMSAAPSSGATLNMDGIGAVAIINQNASSLAGGEWPANSYQNFVYDGTNWIFLNDTTIAGAAASAASAVLTASAGCSLVLIASAAAASSATIDFTSIGSTYNEYRVNISNLVPASNGTSLYLRVSEDNGSSFKAGAGNYGWGNLVVADNSGLASSGSAADTQITLVSVLSSNASNALDGTLSFHIPSSSSAKKGFMFDGVYINSGANMARVVDGGKYLGTTNAINGIRFLLSSGNIATGNFELYGVKTS